MSNRYFVRAEAVPAYHPANHTGTVNKRLIDLKLTGAKNIEIVCGTLQPGNGALPHAHPGIRITGRSAFLALLKDEGVTHLFGNPGTTELPIMHALKEHPDLTYVMAMQESLVVAIADGFSRASGRLVACNVHVAPGLGNAMGALYNAKFTATRICLYIFSLLKPFFQPRSLA